MTNAITDPIYNQKGPTSLEGKPLLSQEGLAVASLSMSLANIHRGLGLFDAHAHLPACPMDDDLFQEVWPSRKAANKKGRGSQKLGVPEGESLHSKHSDTVDSSHLQNRQALFESKGLLTRLRQRAQDSLVDQLKDRLKILQEQEAVCERALEKFEKLAEKLKGAWGDFQQIGKEDFNFDVAKGCFSPFISYLREYYADDPDMLEQIDKLEQDESLSEGKLHAWNRRSWLFRFFSSWRGDDGHAMSIFYDSAYHILSGMMEPVLRGGLPRMSMNGAVQGMVRSQEDLNDWMRTVHTQMLDVLSMLAILGEGDKDAIFVAEAILMSLVRLALDGNSEKDKDQVRMMDMNIQVQEKNFEKADKNLEAIRTAQHRHTIFGWISTIIMVFVCVLTLLSGQLWMAALMIGFSLMSEISVHGSSLMHLLTGGLGKVFEKMGLNEKLAKVMSDIMVIVVFVALIAITPSIAARCGGDLAAGGAAEAVVGDAAAGVDGGIAGNAAAADGAVGDANGGVFQRIWQGGKVPMMTSGMLMSLTEFPTDFAQAVTQKKGAQNIISILLEVLAAVLAVGGGWTVLSSGSGGGVLQRLVGGIRRTRFGNCAPRLLEWVDTHVEAISIWAYKCVIISMATQGGISIFQGVNQLYAGTFKKEYEDLAGNTAMISCAEDIVGRIVNNNQSDLKKLTKAWALFVKNMDAPALASLGVAHALAQSA